MTRLSVNDKNRWSHEDHVFFEAQLDVVVDGEHALGDGLHVGAEEDVQVVTVDRRQLEAVEDLLHKDDEELLELFLRREAEGQRQDVAADGLEVGVHLLAKFRLQLGRGQPLTDEALVLLLTVLEHLREKDFSA